MAVDVDIKFLKGEKVVAKKDIESFGYECVCAGDVFIVKNVTYNYVGMVSEDDERVSITLDKYTFYECFERFEESICNDDSIESSVAKNNCKNVTVKDRVVLINEVGNLNTIGQVYEVARMTENFIVVRDCETKVAVASINIEEFGNYFAKEKEHNGWTKWSEVVDPRGNMIAQYRTNNKKVEVRITNDMLGYPDKKVIRSTATCSQGDEFNLAFGVQLAYLRCEQKYLRNEINEYCEIIDQMNNCESRLVENKSIIKKMLVSLEE